VAVLTKGGIVRFPDLVPDKLELVRKAIPHDGQHPLQLVRGVSHTTCAILPNISNRIAMSLGVERKDKGVEGD
jgi:hypothetical protein